MGMKGIVGLIAVLAATLSVVPSAQATFPGRDGKLAVVPVVGPGVELVDPNSGIATSLCAGPDTDELCAPTSMPSWSSDGRLLAFSTSERGGIGAPSSESIQLVDPAGDCVACGTEPTMGTDPVVTFPARASILDVSLDGTLSSLIDDGVTGSAGQSLNVVGATAANWSSTGRLAIARDGVIWIGRPGHLRRLARGSAPSWSPSGSAVAYGSRGWVVVQRPGARARRLVRGYGPVWSPDGRHIAFFGKGRRLELIAASGGRAHQVGDVSGYGASWQPLTAPTGCLTFPGEMTVASSPTVQVGAVAAGRTAYLTCDTATGATGVALGGFTSAAAAHIAINGQEVAIAAQFGPQVVIATTNAGREAGVMVADSTATAADAIVVDPTGAWTAILTTPSGAEVLAGNGGDRYVLDTAPSASDLTALTIDGESVSWLHEGVPHSATLQPFSPLSG
jgi:hypothetical protein